jgi:hypothetical protein
LLPQLERVLQSCERELAELTTTANNAKSEPSDGWLKQWTKGFSWAVDDSKVQSSCLRIEGFKATLSTALSLVGR